MWSTLTGKVVKKDGRCYLVTGVSKDREPSVLVKRIDSTRQMATMPLAEVVSQLSADGASRV